MAGKESGIDVLFSFDTTGSMYPCLARVRRVIRKLVTDLFAQVDDIRVGIIAHGDYCDRWRTYVTKQLGFSRDVDRICTFVSDVAPTGGGDAEECYELVLHKARSMAWQATRKRVLVMIGDDVPHAASDPQNSLRLDWKNEARFLKDMDVAVYGVQALHRSYATSFYDDLARLTGGLHLKLDQFEDLGHVLMGVCYQQAGVAQLERFEAQVVRLGRMNRGTEAVFLVLSGKSPTKSRFSGKKSKLERVPPGRFQVMRVDDDCDIKGFVEENGAAFKKGRGFYEFTKAETIQDYKEVVLEENSTGDLYTGGAARKMLSLPESGSWRGRPGALSGHTAFVQSTSLNRKLVAGTRFLYEVDLDQ